MTISTPSRPGRWLSVLLIVLGSLGAVYAIGGGVVRGVAAHAATSQSWTADADGVAALRIDTSAAAFQVRYADVDEATLDVTTDGGPVQQWRLERSGDALVVDADRRWRWFGFGIMFADRAGEERAVLTLPAALERDELDLEASVAAGSLEADGSWGAVVVDLSAGSAELAGTAASLDLDVSAGEARLDLADARTVDLQVSAGRIVGALTGDQPDAIVASASAGSVELAIPDGTYDVTEDASAGDATIDVTDEAGSASTIDVDVSAGSVTLRGESR
ncbi:hypothetical protein D8Y24_07150 [Agrococcus lahaulensis]|nr:hypothetical protein D8Y24_07150 [Agrococcus lahaulensis]